MDATSTAKEILDLASCNKINFTLESHRLMSLFLEGHKWSNSEIEVVVPLGGLGVVLVVELQAAVQTGFTAWLLLLPKEMF